MTAHPLRRSHVPSNTSRSQRKIPTTSTTLIFISTTARRSRKRTSPTSMQLSRSMDYLPPISLR